MKRGGELQLTRRQWECLCLAADHRSAKEIGRALGIMPTTVVGHLDEAIAKLGASDRRDAARMFVDGKAGPPPDGVRGEFLRVSNGAILVPDPAQKDEQDNAQPMASINASALVATERGPVEFHFLRGSRRSNELSGSQRIVWIVAASIAAAILFATSVVVIDRLSALFIALRG